MTLRKYTFSLFVLTLFLTPYLHSQFPKYPQFRILTLDDGLPQSGVYDVLQDSKGYIWMLTGDGLCRYDGYRFQVYKHDKEDSTTVMAGTSLSIIEDNQGFLWIAYRENGLSRMNPLTGKCEHFKYSETDSASLCSNDVRILCKDERGIIYAGTNKGLNIIDPHTKKISRFIFKPFRKGESFDDNSIWSLLPDGDKLWVGLYRSGGLHCFDTRKKTFTTFHSNASDANSLISDYVVAMRKDKNNKIWISTRAGLCVYDPAQNKFTRHPSDPDDSNSPVSNDLWGDMLVDRNNNVWIGSFADGLTYFSASEKKFQRVQHHPDIGNSLSSNAVRCIFEDASGMIWIGTSNGLNIYDPRHESFQVIRNVTGDPNTLSGKQINCMRIDRKKRLWLAIANEGIDVYDTKTGEVTHLKHDDKDKSSLPISNVKGFAEDKNGVMHITAFGCPAVCRFDEETKKFVSLGGCWGTALADDKAGRIWAGSSSGLGPIDSLDKYAVNNADSSALGGRVINHIQAEDENKLWVAAGSVLNLFDIRTRKTKRFKFEYHVFCVHKDAKGRYWAATIGGLAQFDVNTGEIFRTITTKNGIANDVVSGIEEDESGNFWLATNKGISCYNPDSGTALNYDVKDGLPNNESNGGSTGHDGKFYFGSMNGITVLEPSRIRRNNYKAPITITMVSVLNEPSALDKSENLPSLTLTHDQYFFSFEFALLDFADPGKNQFAYKLEGFNEDWVNIGTKHEVTFTNLNPGTYTLLIRGANNHAVWNDNGEKILITVLPPWWRTKWFYALVVASIFGSIYIYIKWRERKLKAEKKILEDKVNERTAEVVQQKEIIEEKHKEITDSINYAQRIQKSLLASEELLKENLNDYFIFFQPKDVVSGDFYWAGKLSNGHFALVTADSTGHGVPGAIMSMLNISCIEKAVEVERLTNAGEILNQTRKRVIETLSKDGSAEGGKDGMDCSIVIFDKHNSQVKFAAANNNLWLMRSGSLYEYKADKMPVGRHDKQHIPFAEHSIDVMKGDVIYMFTDGFGDQFGGAEGKKLKSSGLKQLLVSGSSSPLKEQAAILRNHFEEWKGTLEQVDDVCIIGIRI